MGLTQFCLQTMSCKLLLNLVECIKARSEQENANGRNLLMQMMEVFVLKFKSVAKLQLPVLMAKHRQPVAANTAGGSGYPDSIGSIKTEGSDSIVKQEVKTEGGGGLNRSLLSNKDDETKRSRYAGT